MLIKLAELTFIFLILSWLGSFSPPEVKAWGGDIHAYLCLETLQSVPDGCGIADSLEFKKTYPFAGDVMNHLCLDNKPDCPPRVLAKYYVKKYFIEGKKDLKLLAGAAHLIQDSFVPDHWYPMREFFGKIFVPFAPGWVGTTEDQVSIAISSKKSSWGLVREFDGKTFEVNQAYLDQIKEKVQQTVSIEPTESLEALESQVKSRSFWQSVRSFREWMIVGGLIIFPFLIYQVWRYLRRRKFSEDFVITAFVTAIFVIFVIVTYLNFS